MQSRSTPPFQDPPQCCQTKTSALSRTGRQPSAYPFHKPLADEGVDLLRLLRGGHLARADGPHRLIGHHHIVPVCSTGIMQSLQQKHAFLIQLIDQLPLKRGVHCNLICRLAATTLSSAAGRAAGSSSAAPPLLCCPCSSRSLPAAPRSAGRQQVGHAEALQAQQGFLACAALFSVNESRPLPRCVVCRQVSRQRAG